MAERHRDLHGRERAQTGSIETTALAALAFLRADDHPQMANAALTEPGAAERQLRHVAYHAGDDAGAEGLLQSVRAGSENVDATVTVKLDGGAAAHACRSRPRTST